MMVSNVAAEVVNGAQMASGLIPSSLAQNVQAVGAAWVISSTVFTTYSTTKFLKYVPAQTKETTPGKQKQQIVSPIPRTTLLTILRFSGSLLIGLLAHPDFYILARMQETIDLAPAFVLPAFCLFVANYMNSVGLDRIGISLTYTSKCAIPLFTLILSTLIDGTSSLPKPQVLLTLIPIATGIATASWNHPHFETVGFLAAIISCIAQSALNVTSKKIMSKKGIAGPLALRVMVFLGLIISSTVSIFQFYSARRAGIENDSDRVYECLPPAWLGLMASLAYHSEYALSFTFVKLVAPITYSACDAVRRLGIIVSGHFMFGGPPFTKLNIFGIMLALSGALSYSILNH